MTVSFSIPGKPRAWQRAGINTTQGRAIIYTKAESRSYQSVIRDAALSQWRREPSQSPFALSIVVRVRRPKQHYTRGALKPSLTLIACPRRPDLDNVAKQVGDALNGVVWHDDAQVTMLAARRVWAEHDEVQVELVELGGVTQ